MPEAAPVMAATLPLIDDAIALILPRAGVRTSVQARPCEARERRASESTITATASTAPVIM